MPVAWSEPQAAEIVRRHAGREGALLPILHDLQAAFRCIPPAAVPFVAHALNLTRAEVHGVVTFYREFRAVPAVLFYLIYIAGLTWFAVRAGIAAGPRAGALNGAMFGLACYGTYDLTNQATLVHWSSQITVLDLIWGTSASALAAALASEMAGRWLMPELRKS